MNYTKMRIANREDYNKIYEIISLSYETNEVIVYPAMGDLDFKAFFESSFNDFNGTNGWYWFYGRQELDYDIPSYSFPEGYTVRPITDKDIPQKVELMGACTGDISLDVEKYKELQTSLVYEPSTDLVVIDESGKVVSFCNG